MNESKRTFITICFLAITFVIFFGVYKIVSAANKTAAIDKYHTVVKDFEDTVAGDLEDTVLDAHGDIKDTEISGSVYTSQVKDWYEYKAYIDITVYVDRNLSNWDPYKIQEYVNQVNDNISERIYEYRRTDFPLNYYMSREGEKELEDYLLDGGCLFFGFDYSIKIKDTHGDAYEYSFYGYHINGEVVELPRKSSGSSSSSSGSGSGHSSSGHHSTGSSYYDNDYAWDVDDYDDPDEYADDAWGMDFDDWDDAYDYWEDNY